VHTTICLRCDAGDAGCGLHQVDVRTSPLLDTPIEAAAEVRAATAWLSRRLDKETEESLRDHHPGRGHPPMSRGDD
jgi:hypothetical protein